MKFYFWTHKHFCCCSATSAVNVLMFHFEQNQILLTLSKCRNNEVECGTVKGALASGDCWELERMWWQKTQKIPLALMTGVGKIEGIMPLVRVWFKAAGKQAVHMKVLTSINLLIYCKNARKRCLEWNNLKTSVSVYLGSWKGQLMNSKQTCYLLITIVAMCVHDDINSMRHGARWKKKFFKESNIYHYQRSYC